jgi:hypothetical protein
MSKIQYAQQQAPPPEQEVATAPRVARPDQLSLPEMIRIMDVATVLRKEQEIIEEQLNLDQIKVRLRERLLEAARVSGEPITAEQIDVALADYYDKLHSFEEPAWSWNVLLAHLYVHRITIVKWAVTIAAVAGLVWGL